MLGRAGQIVVRNLLRQIQSLSVDEYRYLIQLLQDEDPDIGVREPLNPRPSQGGASAVLDLPEEQP